MKQLTGNQVRQMFLDYFKSKGHMIEPGASLIPHNDPTLLWINAGVAALKKYFDGSEKPACNRIANAQKSIRTNDIENVGKTARHHTFFQMFLSGGNVAFDAAAADLHGGSNLFQLHVVIITHDQHLFFIKG